MSVGRPTHRGAAVHPLGYPGGYLEQAGAWLFSLTGVVVLAAPHSSVHGDRRQHEVEGSATPQRDDASVDRVRPPLLAGPFSLVLLFNALSRCERRVVVLKQRRRAATGATKWPGRVL